MITICCPTRGRPQLAQRMAESCWKQAKFKNSLEIILYANNDDPVLNEYDCVKEIDGVTLDVGPNQSTCYSWNQCATKAKNDYVMLMGDDVIFETPEWDRLIVDQYEKYDDKILMVIPNDGRKNGTAKSQPKKNYINSNEPVLIGDESFGAPHFVLHKNWINTLGYFAPPIFWHWYVDTWTQKVSRKVNRCLYMPNVVCRAKKMFDHTGQLVRGHLNIIARDNDLWKFARDRYLKSDVQELEKFISTFSRP